jgi:predicted dinucleotide-binding enzyme
LARQVGAHGADRTFAEAARAAEIVVLAVKGAAAESVLDLAGVDALRGKVVIDTTNPIAALRRSTASSGSSPRSTSRSWSGCSAACRGRGS